MRPSRRGLFGLFAGALSAPYLPARRLNITRERSPTTYYGYEMISVTRADVLAAAEYDWSAVPLRHHVTFGAA